MSTTATAPGKLVLLGEYVVLEGAPALVAAMDRRAKVVAEARPTFSLCAPDLGVQDAAFNMVNAAPQFANAVLQKDARLDLFKHAVATAYAHAAEHGQSLKPCHLQLDTRAFLMHPGGPKLGLGSSAALTVSLLAALLGESALLQDAFRLSRDAHRHAVLKLAHAAHSAAQGGVGSGIDIACSIWGGVVRFERSRNTGHMQVGRVRPMAHMHVLPVWGGAPASTRLMLSQVESLKAQAPRAYWDLYEKLAIYATAGAEFWALSSTDAFLSVVEAFHTTLLALGEASGASIVTPTHAGIHRCVRRAGGFYKTSGAGGGDLGVAFCASAGKAERVAARVKAKGHTLVPMNIDPTGLQVTFG